ncbi:hypothetical protein FZEAL_5348 [Fusarium zealandicum]|uniref:Uncharacterized protein n=1 Tax=Fusarium zealandicum TaxID=1053134 RepID=A0A8H4UJX4_9HYPO|nr:hypothetical protein FZEAL_5348 [Fusarium zealandicum]
MNELPRYVGSSPVLDASISAFIASFNALHNNESQLKALDSYVGALAALRKSPQVPARTVDNMSFRSIDVSATRFCYQKRVHAWFWQLLNTHSTTRPLKSGDGKSFLTLEIATIAEVSYFLRAPDKYVYQIRCTYSLMQSEYPILGRAVQDAVQAAAEPDASAAKKRMATRFRTAYAVLLAVACMLNRVIRSYDKDDPSLITAAEELCDEIISLSVQSFKSRPLAASSMPMPLIVAWASIGQTYRTSEVEALLMEYQNDFPGLNYFDQALRVKAGFDIIEQRSHGKEAEVKTPSQGGDDQECREMTKKLRKPLQGVAPILHL